MSQANSAAGYSYATAAYLFWGVAPVYFMLVSFAEPLEILAQRILWSIPLLTLLVLLGRQYEALRTLPLRTWLMLGVCSSLLALNWLTFIYGILQGRIAETSLGYFLNPLITIALGTIVLREELRGIQWLAVALASIGVAFEYFSVGSLPAVALVLAGTFGIYGLLRKQIAVPAALGLGIETLFLLPFVVGYLMFFPVPERSFDEDVLLALGGVITVVPLVWFGAAAARLRLSTLGFFQYLAPTLSLLLAVWVYQEEVSDVRWFSFIMVWVSIVLYSFESYWRQRNRLGTL